MRIIGKLLKYIALTWLAIMATLLGLIGFTSAMIQAAT